MINHPSDLDAWERWQRSHGIERIARRAIGRLRGGETPLDAVLLTRGTDDWSTLAVVDAPSPTIARAIVDPASKLGAVAIMCTADTVGLIPGEWTAQPISSDTLARAAQQARSVLSIGHHLPLSAAVFAAAPQAARYVVQHGLLTPFAPPLPADCTLLAWSDADAAFWKSGRADVETIVVGSQLLWQVSDQAPADQAPVDQAPVDLEAPPVFLGQLHGAELPRIKMARTATAFCTSTGATYRPHPAERDKLSRLQHARWRRQGITVDATGPLSEVRAPIVSVFSTGVLEAAARGAASWVVCDAPPHWLREFWQRYELRQWGGAATPAPQQPEREPAQTVADLLR